MDKPFPVADASGAARGRARETPRTAPESRRRSSPVHLPDTRSAVWDRVGHRTKTRHVDRSAPALPAGGARGPDTGREYDLPGGHPRNAASPRSARTYPRDEECRETETDRVC